MPAPFRHQLRAVEKGINSRPATGTAKQAPETRENTWAKMPMVPVGTGKICTEVVRATGHRWSPAVSTRLSCRQC